MAEKRKVFVIDDDDGAREALFALLSEHEFDVEMFASAQSFIDAYKVETPGCIILDIQMPGMSGLELQEHLIEKKYHIPIIFVTGQGTISWSVQAMRNGAVNFLEKPYDDKVLISSVNDALEQDALNRRIGINCDEIHNRYLSLSNREKEVIEYLVYGVDESTNKLIAKKMNISHRTVEEYRAEAMKKMQARNSRELITMIIVCKLHNDMKP